MDHFPPDRFPNDSTPATSFSPPHSSSMPPPQSSSFRSSDEPDPFKISFLKGPKRKRLAKACDACHKSKRRCDGTAPCSNCYFAAKECTYTDSSGRPVPAPLASKNDKPSRAAPSQSRRRLQRDSYSGSPVSASASSLPSTRGEPLTSPQDAPDARGDHAETSKRPRLGSFPTSECQPPASRSTFAATRFEVSVVRELVNLFFAHCHPHRLLIHHPTFMADVSLGRIPSYLLYALCALAAPFSKHPTVRTDTPRTAGLAYAKAAQEAMFDSYGRLTVDRNLMTAQALCLLESHQSLFSFPWPSSSTHHRECHHQLALTILKEDLHIQDEHHASLTSAPTTSFELDAIGHECSRRTFWYIRLMHLTTFMYFKISTPPLSMDLNMRLPVDEASFEFSAHNCQSEYLHLPAPRTQYVSEYGHLLRIASLHGRLEAALNTAGARSTTHDKTIKAFADEAEQEVSVWEASLADHIRYSEENAAHHLAMFETSSNGGAWCFFMMHTLQAWCALTLSEVNPRGSSTVLKNYREWARDRLMVIGTKLGGRLKNSILLVAIILALSRFGMSEHPQVVTWAREYTEVCGMEPPTKFTGKSPMPLAEAIASTTRPTLPPIPLTPASTTSLDRVEDRSDTSSTGSSGTYFSSLRSSYNKLRLTSHEPVAQGQGSAPSLPSLKSCGLLEPWAHQPQPPSQQPPPPESGMPEASTSPTPPWIALRATSKEITSGPSDATTSPSTLSRSSKSTMPVGLDWLANEP